MTELQIILIVCAAVFVGSLYWWGKKSKNEPIQRAYRKESLPAETPEEEGYEVTPLKRAEPSVAASSHLAQAAKQGMLPRETATKSSELAAAEPKTNDAMTSVAQQAPLFVETAATTPESTPTLAPLHSEQDALSARMSESPAYEAPVMMAATPSSTVSHQLTPTEAPQQQLFALLVLSASAKFTRKQLHVAMEASRLNFHHDGTYVKQDANGNIIFRIANVVEPGYFPPVDDAEFESPGVALVLELPNAMTPYRAMDEFITVARKVSQNLSAKLYDAQRHLIKESDLKAMREYAQSLTF